LSREYTNKQLERMVLGAVEDPNCVFYEQSKMNPDLSKAAGKRVYQTVLMVKYTQPGVTDWAPARAQKADIEKNQEAYNYFEKTRGDVGAPSINIIPGISPNEAQELIDYGMLTITQLCEAQTLPQHLQHVQDSARRINEVLTNEQQSNEEGYIEENTQLIGNGNARAGESTQDVPAPGRRQYAGDERRPVVEDCEFIPAGKTEIRPGKGGRINSRQRAAGQVNGHDRGRSQEAQKQVGFKLPSTDWNLSFG
jgi:hypothetical protein